MNNPSTIGGVGLGATAGGSLLSGFGALASGISNSNAYNYQASVARLNQQIDQQNAEFAVQTGEQQAEQFGLKARDQMGQIKVAQASSGFDVNSGSNAAVRQGQQTLNTLGLETIRSNAAKQAYNFEEQGTVAGAQASLDSMAANNSLIAGATGMGASFLGGAGSVSSAWLQGNRVGLWNGG